MSHTPAPTRPPLPPIGLEEGTVRLVPYSESWAALFRAESARVRKALGARMVEIAHIGSTAVPGMPAKPILDVAVGIRGADDVEAVKTILGRLGYHYRGEYGLSGRHFFVRGHPHTHYLHVVVAGSPHWTAWLAFRDYVLRDARAAAEYSTLKQTLAARHAADRDAYTRAKGTFIRSVLERAGTQKGA